jgi:hypothetical protein
MQIVKILDVVTKLVVDPTHPIHDKDIIENIVTLWLEVIPQSFPLEVPIQTAKVVAILLKVDIKRGETLTLPW